MELNKFERVCLLNQYTILREFAIIRNDKHDESHYNQLIEVLSSGYTYDYEMIDDELYEELEIDDCKYVWNTLNMYSAIYCSYSRLQDSSIPEEKILFPGFDGNEECSLLSYCKFIIFTLNRFCELANDDRCDFNSHCNLRTKYENMYNCWNDFGAIFDLSEEQIKAILDCWLNIYLYLLNT